MKSTSNEVMKMSSVLKKTQDKEKIKQNKILKDIEQPLQKQPKLVKKAVKDFIKSSNPSKDYSAIDDFDI